MIKNIFLLGLLTAVTMTWAKQPIAHETLGEAETFKIDMPVKEKKAGRTFAGDKTKNQKKWKDERWKDEVPTGDSDSEVRYWRYSEE